MEREAATTTAGALPGLTSREKTLLDRIVPFARRNPGIAAGSAVFLFMVLIAIFGDVLFTGDPNEPHVIDRLQAPSSTYWFGTDFVGRDVYTRTILGTRISLLVGVLVALIAVSTAVVIGLLTGYFRKVDAVVMRIMDGLMAIPGILLAMALMALLGGSVQNVIIALTVVAVPRTVRVVRASVLSLREQMFVDAARAVGAQTSRILLIHILPNTIAPLIVLATFLCAESVLIEAALSFFGAGTPADIPSWGSIMADGRRYISQAMWVVIIPGIFLTLTVLAINLAGDGLRDVLDPKLKHRL
jgi:peptide/nickel transport system permease protein